ncbi:hypothetical protein MAPG_03437 [Magnaporthiopsis poae ATCC 64411]|uniref:Uncharacterized protein n=1 Tax=Magnaporthiopsis poae (strain ATCC 64411 / 73-15) TaxID=644358 RepID=A0A0C4DU06_MAGP6|nr:hypothetical protein MAPG_03437 [Magnaporthiopsis poae ATCC 64411]
MPSHEEIERHMTEVATLYANSCSTAKSALEIFLYDELAIQCHIEDPNGLLLGTDTPRNHADELSLLVNNARCDSALLATNLRQCHEWVSPLWSAADKDQSRQLDDFCRRQNQYLEKAMTRTDMARYAEDIGQLNLDIEDVKPIAKVLVSRLSNLIRELDECKVLVAGFCDKLAAYTPCDHWARLQMLHGAALKDFDN